MKSAITLPAVQAADHSMPHPEYACRDSSAGVHDCRTRRTSRSLIVLRQPFRRRERPLRSNSLSRVVTATTSRSAPVPSIGTLELMRSTHLAFSLFISATGSHVPHESPVFAHAASIPDADWAKTWVTARLISGNRTVPDFDIIRTTFSILHQQVRLRSSSNTTPNGYFRLFLNAHHQDS